MSDLLNDLDLSPERETVKEPPKRWRNWWRSTSAERRFCDRCLVSIEPHTVGTVFSSHCQVWPSKDVAETYANWLIKVQAREGFLPDDHIGAFPDGEAP